MTLKVHPLPLRMSSAYLLENQDGLYLVDAGSPGAENKILQAIQKLNKSLRLIFITHAHFDHYGAVTALRRLTGAPVAIHAADAQAMAEGKTPIRYARGRGRLVRALQPLLEHWIPLEPTSADLLLQDGDRLDDHGLDARLLHTPGHTPGSSCLVVEERLVFAGDLLSANGRPHAQHLFADDWSQIPASLARLQAARPEWVYAGHGIKPVSGATLQKL
jgi:hydroxyacylglutathione hydrolase